jgi:hypothetical protein
MKIYVNTLHTIEVDDKYLPLLTNANSYNLHQEFCAEVKKQMGMPYSDSASEKDKAVIIAVYDNCFEPLIEC